MFLAISLLSRGSDRDGIDLTRPEYRSIDVFVFFFFFVYEGKSAEKGNNSASKS